jgi:L-methionine (R)-S-oxide reductase
LNYNPAANSPDLKQITGIILAPLAREAKLLEICQLLRETCPYYNWVGFYLADREREELVLGPYVGEPTQYVRIPYGKGICGQVAVSHETLIVQDVVKIDNYLSCSVNVKAEMVVPIFKDGQFVAELDIDSYQPQPFTQRDRAYLSKICRLMARLF